MGGSNQKALNFNQKNFNEDVVRSFLNSYEHSLSLFALKTFVYKTFVCFPNEIVQNIWLLYTLINQPFVIDSISGIKQ